MLNHRKLSSLFFLILIISGFLYTVFIFLYGSSTFRGSTLVSKLTGGGPYATLYRKDISLRELMKMERENVFKIIELEKDELQSVGIDLNLMPAVRPEVIVSPDIRVHYKYRNVDEDAISKLSVGYKVIEHLTDPLLNSASCSRPVYVTVAIISSPWNFDRREVIRDAWSRIYEDDYMKVNNSKPFPYKRKYKPEDVVKVVFITAVSKDGDNSEIFREAHFKKDIVFGSFVEDYKNLTLKTKLALKWAHFECDTSFLLKTDDDVYVNPVALVEWLKGLPQQQLYTGWCNSNSPVIRDPKNKWYVSKEYYAGSHYPAYCLGGGYLMSQDVLKYIVDLSYNWKIFPMEDLYVGLMIHEMGIKACDERKHFLMNFVDLENECSIRNIFVAHHVMNEKHKILSRKSTKSLIDCV